MLLVKGDKNTEACVMPTEQELAAMGRFNEELVKAGILLAGDGLHPSSKGAKVRWKDGKRTVIDGPFAEAKELVAGYWIIDVKSKAEAIEWMMRCPMGQGEAEVEIRQVFELTDFAPGPAVDAHTRLRDELAKK